VVSIISSKLMGGMMEGMRWAIMVLPAPGGPTKREMGNYFTHS
jgi:hypothetical protein